MTERGNQVLELLKRIDFLTHPFSNHEGRVLAFLGNAGVSFLGDIPDAEKWLGHPGNVKDLGDWAFCEGINRFVFHRYALQPWLDRKPGMSMGPWGLHYERTQTWWERSKPWHEYLARCQYLLQKGRFVADICLLGPEGAPQSLNAQQAFMSKAPGMPLERPGYNFDACPPVLEYTSVSSTSTLTLRPEASTWSRPP